MDNTFTFSDREVNHILSALRTARVSEIRDASRARIAGAAESYTLSMQAAEELQDLILDISSRLD